MPTTTSPHHSLISRWFENLLASDETVGLPWSSAWAFVRIITNPRISSQPLLPQQAISVLTTLREHPHVAMVNPGRRHERLLLEQMIAAQVLGPQTTAAVLAALAIENGATLASTDVGFRRFPDLTWLNPLA